MGSILMLRLMRLRDDYILLIFMTIMALGLTYVFGGPSTNEYKPTVLIVDEDKTEYSSIFIEELRGMGYYNYELVKYKEAVDKVEQGKSFVSLVIKKGFQSHVLNGYSPEFGLIKVRDNIEIFTLENIISTASSKILNNISIAKTTSNFIVNEKENINKDLVFIQAYNRANENWIYRRPIEVTRQLVNRGQFSEYDNLKHMLIGFSLFFSMYTIVFGIGEILSERKYNTWQRQLISPIRRTSIVGGNIIVTFIIGCVQLGILILGGKYLFGIDWGKSILGILTISASFVFSVTALGLLLSGLVKTHGQLSAVTPIVLTSTAMLGGCMWPLEIVTSKVLLFLANFTPQKWALEGMEKIAMYGYGFEAAITPSLVLIIMGFIFFGIGVKLVKFE